MNQPETTADVKPEPTMISVPVTSTETKSILESKPNETSDQMREPATTSVPEEILLEFEGMT